MEKRRMRTEQVGYETAEDDELGSGAVVVDDANQRAFGRRSGGACAEWVIGDGSLLSDVRRRPRRGLQRGADRHTHAAMVRPGAR